LGAVPRQGLRPAGARANLELVAAVADEADADRLWRFSASGDEFLALCGRAGLGRLALLEPDTVLERLRKLASDPRWRVREGVAIALQRIGRADMRMLLTEMRDWARGEKWLRSRGPDVGVGDEEQLARARMARLRANLKR
jgi:hypothetical protein